MTQKQRDEYLHNEKNWAPTAYMLQYPSSPSLGQQDAQQHVRILKLYFAGNSQDIVLIRLQAKAYGMNYRSLGEHDGLFDGYDMHGVLEELWRDVHLFREDIEGRWAETSWTGFKDAMREADKKKGA